MTTTYDTITLDTYAHVWRLAYEAFRAANDAVWGRTEEKEETLTDREMFVRHSSKGHEAEKFDWDSESDFIQWKQDNRPYHNLDVVYARVHLWPHHDKGALEWRTLICIHG